MTSPARSRIRSDASNSSPKSRHSIPRRLCLPPSENERDRRLDCPRQLAAQGFEVRGSGFRVQSSMLDVRCWMFDVGCWMLDVGCWLFDVCFSSFTHVLTLTPGPLAPDPVIHPVDCGRSGCRRAN